MGVLSVQINEERKHAYLQSTHAIAGFFTPGEILLRHKAMADFSIEARRVKWSTTMT